LASSMTANQQVYFDLVRNLDGAIDLFVISGANTEPTLNKRLIELLELVKSTGSNFGLHSNGILFPHLETSQSFVQRLVAAATKGDYVSISLDAGSPASFAATKGIPGANFRRVIKGLSILRSWRRELASPLAVQATYLMNEDNSSTAELARVIRLVQLLKVDSLRFSIPYAPYGTTRADRITYKRRHEVPFAQTARRNLLAAMEQAHSLQSKVKFSYLPPETQDVERMVFHHCFTGPAAAVIGADGNYYRCTATANGRFAATHSLGPADGTVPNFIDAIFANQQAGYDPQKNCLPNGAHCTRAAMEFNLALENRYFSQPA